MKIFELFGSIFVESDQANQSMDKTDSKAKKIAGSLGKGIKTAAKWSAAIVGGATVVGGAMLKAGEKFAETTDRVDKLSQRLGLSREGFQEWDFVLSQAGVSIDSMQMGMKTMSQRMDDVIKGGGKGVEIFDKLNVSVVDATGAVRSQEDVFNEAITALQGMDDGIEKAALAQELFGRNGQDLLPLLNSEAEGVEELKKQARDMGLVLGDDAIDAGVKFTDTMDAVKRTVKGLATGLMGGIMPTLQGFLEMIQSNMPVIRDVLQDVFKVLATSVQKVLPVLMELIQTVLPPLISLFAELASGALPILIDAFMMIIQNVFPVVIELFTLLITTILPPFLQILDLIVTKVLPPLIELFVNIIQAVLPPLIELFAVLVDTLLPPFIELFEMLIENVLPILIEVFNMFILTVLPPFIELIDVIVKEILPPLLLIFMDLAKATLPLVMDVFKALMPVIGPVMKAIASVIKIILALIKGDWEGVWGGIKEFFSNILDTIIAYVNGFADIFSGIFKGIANVVSGIWNGLVSGIKEGLNFIIRGLNTFIRGINKVKIPDWVPVVGGKGITLPTIPQLAEGGDITQSGRILVGENGPEIFEAKAGAKVTPLEKAKIPEEKTEIHNEFKIAQLVVREEADIKKVARQLYQYQLAGARG
jgi:hypothetical protein